MLGVFLMFYQSVHQCTYSSFWNFPRNPLFQLRFCHDDQDDKPAVLRGPMVNSAFDRMLVGTDWGHLDVLIIDMPPGTGDAQINLGQRVPLSGAVIVSTPQVHVQLMTE